MNTFTDAKTLAAAIFTEARKRSADPGGGITRPSYSATESLVLAYLQDFAHAHDLITDVDFAGNVHFAVDKLDLDGATRAICIGSHIDSVPNGGNYDGLAGIVAGLLILLHVKQLAPTLRPPIVVLALRGEESAWFGVPYLGARAALGQLTTKDLDRQSAADGVALRDHMAACGIQTTSIENGDAVIRPPQLREYWELHIEQGPILVREKMPVGIVTAIRGNVRQRDMQIVGVDGHSGTVPRELRSDAVFAFAEFLTAVDMAWEFATRVRGEDLVVTCGIVTTDPLTHALTRIPGNVRFCVEWRSHTVETLQTFQLAMSKIMTDVAHRRGVTFLPAENSLTLPQRLDHDLVGVACVHAQKMDLDALVLPSGAGHDAAIFAAAGVPTGMIFIRNDHGSHNPHEAMNLDDFLQGVTLLYNIVTRIN